LNDVQQYLSGQRYILCDLVDKHALLTTPVVILDVGARNALADPRWLAWPSRMIVLHGFEPDAAECDALNRQVETASRNFRFHPIALAGHIGSADFYKYAEPAANSLYPPNYRLLDRWCYTRQLTLRSQFELVEKVRIETTTLADWAKQQGITDIDACKLNVQGAELDVLRGAGRLIDGPVSLVLEQTFNRTYIGAPLFGEVYEFVRQSGFCMFDVLGFNLVARTRSPIHLTEDNIFLRNSWARHQFFEGHFLYFRDPILSADEWHPNSTMDVEKCVKLACLAESYGQVEFAFELLSWLASSPQTGLAGETCREVVRAGASLYRAVSASAT
jgi:FkbM family methyltransferase